MFYVEAISFIEDNTLAGSDLTFEANLDSFTISDAYTVVAFIKALDPNNNYATVVNENVEITNGMSSFTLSATSSQLTSGLIIQYGFSVTGALAEAANEATLGSVVSSAKDPNTSDELSVTIDGSNTWSAYVNTFNLADNSFAFGFSYDLAKNKSTLTSDKITLQPNFAIWSAENENSAWFDNSTTPNKTIVASSYVENNALAGSDLNFSANIDAYTIDSQYTVEAFIKALDPNNGYATVVNKAEVLSNSLNSFSISATAEELTAGFVIQYGFAVTGPLGNPANEAALGSVIISAKNSATASVGQNYLLDVSVSPSPASNSLKISAQDIIQNVKVYNLLGKTVLNKNFHSKESVLDVSDLNTGVYMVKYTINNKVGTTKFIKQ